MRMFTGYLFIIIFIPIFMFLVLSSTVETKKVQSFHEVLDEKIVLEETNLSQTSFIKDRNGEIISEIYKPMNRIFIHGDQIPKFLKEILIVSEDQNFYKHPGFDLTAIARALAVNIQAKDIEQGASTITQQLARNLYLSHEQTYNRKLGEILYAYQLERTYSKEEILELYMNSIYFQNGAYGIEAAAQVYFQKSAKDLSKGEMAFLAAIPNNPSYYNPVKYYKRTKERQEMLIDQLAKNNAISQDQAEKIKKEPIKLSLKKHKEPFPDYTTYVEAELKQLIAHFEGYDKKLERTNSNERKKVMKSLNKRVDELMASGIIIETFLDPAVQKSAVQAVKKNLPYSDIEGAAVVLDHQKHEILALTGGKNYKKYDFNRSFQGYRQPGSAIKPLLVYAPYLERTKAPLSKTVSADSLCIKGYCPENFGGETYGMVSLESAFIHSFNTPAVRLLNEIGVENGFKDLSRFQFKKVIEGDHVLPAAIGGFTYGMTPLELTNAYTVFGNNGLYQPSRAIKRVTDLRGKMLYEWKDESVKIWNPETIKKMRILLNKTVLSGTAKKAYFPSSYIGGKTGTTNDFKDYWFIGLTDHITAGVWIGKDNPSSIRYAGNRSPQLLIWKDIVSSIP